MKISAPSCISTLNFDAEKSYCRLNLCQKSKENSPTDRLKPTDKDSSVGVHLSVGGIIFYKTFFLRFVLAFLPSIFTLCGCAHQQPELHAAQYRFNYNNETYRIRSISSMDKKESYNELVGVNFMAVDFDQDRILDRIVLGEARLREAQKIYEYGLDRLTQENKLQVRVPSIDRYVHEKNGFQIEIRSFRPANAQPFNEFIITDSRPAVRPEIIIVVDQNADGKLDEVLKGAVTLAEAQSRYSEAIAAGLQKGELIKVDDMILAKEK